MKFAYVDGEKSRAFKAAKGSCRSCGNVVLAKCGELRLHHWAHITNRDCDSWYEPETEWHRNWKNCFPEDWQEVICPDPTNGGWHRADVFTPRGVTLEFQNSSISVNEIRQRTAFYPKLIWVVNAKSFKHHLHFTPQFEVKANQIESYYQELYWNRLEAMDHDKILLRRRFTKPQQKYSTILQGQEVLMTCLRELDEKIMVVNHNGACIPGPLHTASEQYQLQTKKWDLHSAHTKLDRQVTPLENALSNVLELATCEINGKIYRLIHPGYFEVLSGSIFILDKKIKDQPFQELLPMPVSESSYYRQHNQHYLFLVNTAEYERNLTDQIQAIRLKVIEINRLLSEINQGLQHIQWQELLEERKQILLRIEENELERQQAQQECEIIQSSLENWDIDCEAQKKEVQAQFGEEKYRALELAKLNTVDYYFLDWKHPRLVWKETKAPCFLDVGESYIYYLKEGNLTKRIDKQIFIDKYSCL